MTDEEQKPKKNTLILVLGDDIDTKTALSMFEKSLIFPPSHVRVRT